MSNNSPTASSNDPRLDALRADFQAKQTRLFIGFAVAEGLVLLIAVVAIYGFELVDPDIGIWFIVGIALVGGVFLSSSLLTMMRNYQRNIRDITGW